MPPSLRLRLAGLAMAAAAAGLAFYYMPVGKFLERLLAAIEALGPWGPVALAAVYVPACLLFVPGSLLTLGAGYMFGLVRGGIAVVIGSNLGAAAAFLAGRTLARRAIASRVADNPRFQQIDRAVGEQGARIVLLTRLSPVIPFNLLNYALGLTGVRFRDYVLATAVGMLPGTLLYVYLGSAAHSLTDLASGSAPAAGPWQQALFIVGLAATVLVTVVLTRIARAALPQEVNED